MSKLRTKILGKVVVLCAIVLVVGILNSCSEDEATNPQGGFSDAIKNFVPDSTISRLREMGMEINEGMEPPIIEGIYLVSPMIMSETTVPDDINGQGYEVGDRFADSRYYFKDQDLEKLTISVDQKEIRYGTGETLGVSEGRGAYLSGFDSTFTAFIELDYNLYYAGDTLRSKGLEVISGKISSNGIRDFQFAFVMLNNYGNPYNRFIPNNTGRLFYDEDGVSGTLSSFRVASDKKGEVSDEIPSPLFAK